MSQKKNRKFLYILLTVTAILVVLMIIKAKNQPKGEEVELEEVTKRTIKETVTASGKVFPEKEVKISSDVSGEIVELFVEEGDSVALGQLLAKIDPDAYLSAVERGTASLNNAKAQLAISNSQIENSIAQVEQIKVQLENTERIHERNKKLKEQGIISEADFESSLSDLQSQAANLRAAEASLRSSRQNSKASEFSVKSSQASLKELQTSLQRTSIYSPTTGIISKLNVEQGERVVGTIQMTGTEMMRIANLNNMEVQVEVSESDILRVNNRDEVEIEVDAYLDKKFKGYVTEIANSASNTTSGTGAVSLTSDQVTNFVVKIRIDPESYSDLVEENKIPFRPGMSASVSIFTQTVEDVLSISIQSVTVRDPNEENDKDEQKEDKEDDDLEEVIFIMNADTVGMVLVETGIQDDEFIQILSGVNEKEIIVQGPYKTVSKVLKNGSKVRKKTEKKKEG
jgi:HlyD family secretion protein